MANTVKITQTADTLTSDKISFDVTTSLEQNSTGDDVTQFSGIRRFELAASGTDATTLGQKFTGATETGTHYLYVKNATSGNSAAVHITLSLKCLNGEDVVCTFEISELKEGDTLWLPFRPVTLNSAITITNASGTEAALVELAYYY
tara:strand:+ start:1180 stop:1620 length:441 start_codon:yes stop_codon:yes gene_type:complete